jgi:hypothetical protein
MKYIDKDLLKVFNYIDRFTKDQVLDLIDIKQTFFDEPKKSIHHTEKE